MKKGLLILVFCAVQIGVLNAQILRLAIGLNRSKPTEDPLGFSTNAKLGYQFGADVQLGKGHIYFQPGVKYSVTTIGLSVYSDTKSELVVSGIKIPILVGFRLLKPAIGKLVNIRFYTGPSVLVVTNVKHKNQNDSAFILTDKEYHDVEWAWQLGSGLDIGRFFVDLGYQKGLTYIFTGESNAKSNMFYMNVGLKIPLK